MANKVTPIAYVFVGTVFTERLPEGLKVVQDKYPRTVHQGTNNPLLSFQVRHPAQPSQSRPHGEVKEQGLYLVICIMGNSNQSRTLCFLS